MAARILSRQASPVDNIVSALRSDKASTRSWALLEIAKQGEIGAAQYQLDMQVSPLLEDPDEGVQEQALLALGQMGSRGARQVDGILRKTSSGSKQVKLAGLAALARLGTYVSTKASFAELYLDNQDLDVVVAACTALGGMKATSTADAISKHLQSDDLEVVIAACSSLAAMDRHAEAVARLLSHNQPRVKAAAVQALASMSRREDFASNVAPLLGDEDCYVRIGAAETLCALGSKALPHMPVISKYLSDPHCGKVAAAATAVGGIGPAAASIIPALEAVLGNEKEDKSTFMLAAAGITRKAPPELRKPSCAAALALAHIGSGKSCPKLLERLNSKDPEIRAAAVTALGILGAESARYESNLVDMLKDNSPPVAAAACKALGQLARATSPNASTAAAVAELLADNQPSVRASAAESLGTMGEEADAFLDELSRLFNDKSWLVQTVAIRTVAGCGEMGQMYAADVCRHSQDSNAHVRRACCEALSRMGERGACFAEEIQPLLDDPVPEVSSAAQKALDYFSSGVTAVPALEAPSKLPALTFVSNDDAKGQGPAPAVAAAKFVASVAQDVPAVSSITTASATPSVSATPAVSSTLSAKPTTFESQEPPVPAGLLFPGQGSQYVEMLKDVKDLPAVKSMLDTAQKILGYDLLKLCLEGPEDKLEQTKFCQPAMFIAGLAGLELLKQENPQFVHRRPQAVAGLSLGEYTALAVAGVFDFETGLKLVKLRGEAMQEAAEASPQLMLSIAGLPMEQVEKLCKECLSGPQDVCQVANFLFPNGFSCAGSKAAIEKLSEKAVKAGALQAKVLKTSGAFHTSFMSPAREKLLKALKDVESSMKPPSCEVYMNLTGKKIAIGTPPPQIIDLLGDQLTSCVLWEPSVKAMIKDGIQEFYECGPMKQLKAMMKRIDQNCWKTTTNIHV